MIDYSQYNHLPYTRMKLLFDFFPILLFFITYKIYGIFAATAVAIAASFVQVSYFWWRHRRFETMHLVTLGLVTVLGGATLLLQDRAFFMWKPTAVNWLFALGFLGSHFIGQKTLVERMMGQAIQVPAPIWARLNISWIGFFLLMGFANLYVANLFFSAEAQLNLVAGEAIGLDGCIEGIAATLQPLCEQAHAMEEQWVNFKLFGMLGLTFAFVIAQAFYLGRHLPSDSDPTSSPKVS